MMRSIRTLISTMIFAGVPFGLGMGVLFYLRFGSYLGIRAGIFCGAAFGTVLGIFLELQRRKLEIRSPMLAGETILMQGAANHFLGREARGGWLVLTPTKLTFRSHGHNLQNEGREIALKDVTSVEPSWTLGIVPNGVRIALADGGFESFVLQSRRRWLRALQEALGPFSRPPG
jgi:hypothetical protein